MGCKNKNYFFIDLFNNILDHNNSKVIVIFDYDSNILFGLRNLLKIKQLNAIDICSKYTKYYGKIKVSHLEHWVPFNF